MIKKTNKKNKKKIMFDKKLLKATIKEPPNYWKIKEMLEFLDFIGRKSQELEDKFRNNI